MADIQDIIKNLAERGIGVLITDHNVRSGHFAIGTLSTLVGLAEGSPAKLLANQLFAKSIW